MGVNKAASSWTVMLLTFSKMDSSARPVGSFRTLRFEGELLRESPGAPLIARHQGHRWKLGGEEFLRLDCDGPVTLMFFDGLVHESKRFGPYSHFSSVNCIGYADHHVFCHLDTTTKRWFLRADESEWASLVIQDAS